MTTNQRLLLVFGRVSAQLVGNVNRPPRQLQRFIDQQLLVA
jgi:hypothetical protein